MKPLQLHYDSTRIKPKTRKYVKALDSLILMLDQKTEQVAQALKMAEGLAEGKDTLGIIQYSLHRPKPVSEVKIKEAQAARPPKQESRHISLDLLNQGKSIDEIGRERSMARGTIETHLVSFIPTGEVKTAQIVSGDKEEAIRKTRPRRARITPVGSSSIRHGLC